MSLEAKHALFDPFNHGTTSIGITNGSAGLMQEMGPVLERGWGIINSKIDGMAVDLLHDDRYARFERRGLQLFIKRNRPSHERQLVIDRAESFVRSEGVLAREAVLTLDGESSYLDESGKSYSLSLFIRGEHFDGSRGELLQIAEAAARMHIVMAEIPFWEQIKASKDFPLKHNQEALGGHLERLKTEVSLQSRLPMTIDEMSEASSGVAAALSDNVGLQIVHMDIHPHNVLFDADRHQLSGILDFEQVRLSQRIRDVGYAMHRFSRTYGPLTERKEDVGVDIRVRASQFLDRYNSINPLQPQEFKSLVLVLQDEALTRIGIVLGGFYESGSPAYEVELIKQVTTLKECELFAGLAS